MVKKPPKCVSLAWKHAWHASIVLLCSCCVCVCVVLGFVVLVLVLVCARAATNIGLVVPENHDLRGVALDADVLCRNDRTKRAHKHQNSHSNCCCC